jgi:hypothetical protein
VHDVSLFTVTGRIYPLGYFSPNYLITMTTDIDSIFSLSNTESCSLDEDVSDFGFDL